MLDRKGYVVVTVTERAMMLMMVTTAAMIVVERFRWTRRVSESTNPQRKKNVLESSWQQPVESL